MREWSEVEIFSFLVDHFRKVASASDDLAKRRRRGPVYNEFRKDLELTEDMCRIAGYMRQDARWFMVGRVVHTAHEMAGTWLRGIPRKPDEHGRPRPPLAVPEGELHPRFVWLAEFLRAQAKDAYDLQTRATGRIGPILPRMLEPPEVRQKTNYPVRLPGVTEPFKSKGGIIIPFTKAANG